MNLRDSYLLNKHIHLKPKTKKNKKKKTKTKTKKGKKKKKNWNLQSITENPKTSKQTSKSISIQPKYPKTKSYFITQSKKGGKITDGSFDDLMMAGKWPDRRS